MVRFGWCIALALALGCGEGEEPEPKSTLLFCEANCDLAAKCRYDISDRCVADCAAQVPGLNYYAPEGAAIASECIRGLSCSALEGEQPFAPCWEKAQETLPVREETRAFCAEYAVGIFECGYWYPIEQCERDYVIMTGEFLQRISSCVTPCENFEQCVDATWESA